MDIARCGAALARHRRLAAAVLIAAGAVGAWGISTALVQDAAAVEPRFEAARLLDAKTSLVGSYVVTGTDADGKPYPGAGRVDISLAPSGALELSWDDGKLVGIGQLVGNALAVAYSVKGRVVISVMNLNPDGSLSGRWLRRTERGSKGTETWKRG